MTSNSKIVTLCGSMRFQKEMQELSGALELQNNWLVFQCAYFSQKNKLRDGDVERLGDLHLQKIAMSDAIYVVNVGGYVGESTKREITYARSLGKEILSLEPLI